MPTKYKFRKAKSYAAPRDLVECWWDVLADQGFSVHLDDQPETYSDGSTRSCYYSGAVQSPKGRITVIATPGPPSHSKSEAAGLKLIILGYDIDQLDELACSVGAAIVEAGAKELALPPPTFLARCLRLLKRGT